jgi:hypothetical protein
MFQQIPQKTGMATCQQDHKTFAAMRFSQLASWSLDTLKSYLCDLEQASDNGRNLLTEKYARMMASTAPSEYTAMVHLLPPLDPETEKLIDRIVKKILDWEEKLRHQYPYLLRRGRPLYSASDTETVTSVETYLRGELATYSLKTLKHLHTHIIHQSARGINGAQVTLQYMVESYGYRSPEEANEALKPT